MQHNGNRIFVPLVERSLVLHQNDSRNVAWRRLKGRFSRRSKYYNIHRIILWGHRKTYNIILDGYFVCGWNCGELWIVQRRTLPFFFSISLFILLSRAVLKVTWRLRAQVDLTLHIFACAYQTHKYTHTHRYQPITFLISTSSGHPNVSDSSTFWYGSERENIPTNTNT